MAREDCDAIRAGFAIPPGRCDENPYLGETYSFSSLSGVARGKADSLTIQWVENGNMGTVHARLTSEVRLAVETGEGHARGGVPVVV